MLFRPVPRSKLDLYAYDELFDRIAAKSRGTLSTDVIREALDSEKWGLAELGEGLGIALLNSITFKTGLRALEIVGLAGDEMRAWREAVSEMEVFARHSGYDRMTAGGRKGFERVSAPFGWRMTHVVVEKDLFDA